MNMTIGDETWKKRIKLLDKALYVELHANGEYDKTLYDAMEYSLMAGGKRLRPMLLMAAADAVGGCGDDYIQAACAMEMIHTYSLIHDDLPAMDNDDFRRGKPTNHIQFNEATAILAGDALLTLAFEVITKSDLSHNVQIELIKKLAQTSGYEGMVGGQQADIDGEGSDLSLEEIEHIHLRKTGALIEMATVGAGLIAEKPQEILECLSELAKEIGIAYQVRDDILDVVGTKEDLGKEVATDAALGKSTYPSLLGLEGSFSALNEHLNAAEEILSNIQELDNDFQKDLLIRFVRQLSLEEYR